MAKQLVTPEIAREMWFEFMSEVGLYGVPRWRERGCIVGPNVRDRDGYARTLTLRFGRKVRRRHQLAFIDFWGRWPGFEMQVNHFCDNRPCEQPYHLWEGTHSDNMRDAGAKGRLGHQVKARAKQQLAT